MNATSLEELRAGQARQDVKDDRMEQVRELLFGHLERELQARIAALEQRQRDFETSAVRQMDAIMARIEALAGETDLERRAAFEELSRSVLDLGEKIRSASMK